MSSEQKPLDKKLLCEIIKEYSDKTEKKSNSKKLTVFLYGEKNIKQLNNLIQNQYEKTKTKTKKRK